MSKGPSSPPLGDSILEEATAWFIDLNEGELDAGGRERLNQWLRRSPEHVRAYLEIAAAWEDASRLNHRLPTDHTALVAAAVAGTESNVVPLPGRRGQSDGSPLSRLRAAPGRRGLTRGLMRVRIVGIAASTILAVAGCFFYATVVRDTYSTDTGEQRSIVLGDGSAVELNSRSRLRVRFSKAERVVELIDGQALFHAKHQVSRPFVVVSNGTRVRAVGTTFDVYRKTAGTVVTVIDGRVAVTAPSSLPDRQPSAQTAPTDPLATAVPPVSADQDKHGSAAEPAPILLSAGEQLTVTAQVASQPAPANVDAAIAWTQRRLVFDETPLRDAVVEFNRYNTRQIVIDDPELASYHIRGGFESSDPDRLIQFLRERFGAAVSDNGTEIRISRKQKH
jgi:transmembrane sensor